MKSWGFAIIGAVGLIGTLSDDDDNSGSYQKPSLSKPATYSQPTPTAKSKTMFVTGSVVNVRSGPGTSYAKRFQLKRGTAVTVLSTEAGWVKLSNESRQGWMSGKYLSEVRPQQQKVARRSQASPKNQRCHPSYSGACVPFASDVDCGGGRGNGPAYIWSTVRVVGPDVYRLDRDKDGWGCE